MRYQMKARNGISVMLRTMVIIIIVIFFLILG